MTAGVGQEAAAVAVRPIVGPWGRIEVVVEQSSDGRFYAVLKQPPARLLAVLGSSGVDEAEAVGLLRLNCLRAFDGP